MNWIAWLLLNIVLSMVGKLSNARSATCNSEDQCCLEQSTLGKALIGFTYRTLEKKIPLECYQTCDADSICQSINYDMFKEQCELNNRTRDARPGHFFKDNHRFYVKRITNRVKLGSVKELPAVSCHEIKDSEGDSVVSGYFWLKPLSSNTPPSLAYCGMPSQGQNRRLGLLEKFIVPNTSRYSITAYGARGGTHSYSYGDLSGTYFGGKGAKIQGIFNLTKGTLLNLIVGKRGGDSVEISGGMVTTKTAAELGMSVEDNAGTGGGGGSFVYTVDNNLLIAAGGGGGASVGYHGIDGQAGGNGTSCTGKYLSYIRSGGTMGQPGQCNTLGASWHGGVGAGWLSEGCERLKSNNGDAGKSRVQGWFGGLAGTMNSGNNGGPHPGAVGGFGGGGGGSEDNGASGGGGGYSGGGSGVRSKQAGGGGGSYCGGESCTAVTGGNLADCGMVIIEEIAY